MASYDADEMRGSRLRPAKLLQVAAGGNGG